MSKKQTAFILSMLLFLSCSTPFYLSGDRRRAAEIRVILKDYSGMSWIKKCEAVKKIIKLRSGSDNSELEISLLLISNDPHPAVRIESLKAMSELLSKKMPGRIRTMALEDASDNVRWQAIITLSLYRDPGLSDVFIKCLDDRDWLLREASITALCEIKDPSFKDTIIPALVKAINDQNEAVRIAALKSARFRDKKIYQAIAQMFGKTGHSSNTMLAVLLTALRGYRLDNEVHARVINLLAHTDKNIRKLSYDVLKTEKVLFKKNKEFEED
ncbi:MAG: HEAT repeat domain-containing protein [Spirochaetes bacterium]|nr:HEAT repeat domain-containing protein [Spirochaetota bacterium]